MEECPIFFDLIREDMQSLLQFLTLLYMKDSNELTTKLY